MKRMLNYIFLVMLFLNFSEGFRPLGVLLGISSSSIVSILTLILSIVYIAVNDGVFKVLYKNRIFRVWVHFLLTYPFILMLFAIVLGNLSIDRFLYWVPFIWMYGLLTVTAAIYAFKEPFDNILRISLLSIIVAFIGFVLNYTNYPFIKRVMEFSSAGSASQEVLFRALSFYPNPNSAAFALVLFTILIFSLHSKKKWNSIFYLVLLVFVTGMIFLTGARTSLILIAFLSFFYFIPSISALMSKKHKQSKGVSYFYMFFCGIVFLFLFSFSMSSISDFYGKFMNEDILKRMDFFSTVASGEEVEDRSLEARTSILTKYFDFIGENPLFGHGPEKIRNLLSSGYFENVSQNAFIEGAATYGIPYAVFLLYCLYITFVSSKKEKRITGNTSLLGIMMVILLLTAFSINNLFWFRSVVICLGFLLGFHVKSLYLYRKGYYDEKY